MVAVAQEELSDCVVGVGATLGAKVGPDGKIVEAVELGAWGVENLLGGEGGP